MSFIHGWRLYRIQRCRRTGEVILAGQFGKHVHDRIAEPARCHNGPTTAVWLTEEARARQASHEQHEPFDAPLWDCSCGYYGFRLLKGVDQDNYNSTANVIAHVTCMEKTILHEEGFRTSRYQIDYIVDPERTSDELHVQKIRDDEQVSTPYGFMTYVEVTTQLSLKETLKEIAEKIEVPILLRNSLGGCSDCLVANGIYTQEELDRLGKEEPRV